MTSTASVLEVGEGETVLFSLDGIAYEIDLTDGNAAALRDAFAPYVVGGALDLLVPRRIVRGVAQAPPPRSAGLQRDPRVGEGQRLPGVRARPGSGIRHRGVRSRH